MNFYGKVAVITGGSSGIGKSTAIELLKENCKVIIIGKTKSKVLDTLNELKKISKECSAYVCDVSDEKKVKFVIDDIIKKYDRLDFLINNAGFSNYKEFSEQTSEEIRDIIYTNLFGTIFFCKYVIPYMEKRGGGHILNVASVAGRIGFPKLNVYCASKFGVVGFTESLYYELKEKNINVSLICPGAVNTDFYRDESFKKFPHDKRHKKVLEPVDVAIEIKKTIRNKNFEVIIPRLFKYKIMLKDVLKPFVMWYINRLPK